MKSTKSAGRYAKALLELAQEQNKLDIVNSNMTAIIQAANQTHDFQVFYTS